MSSHMRAWYTNYPRKFVIIAVFFGDNSHVVQLALTELQPARLTATWCLAVEGRVQLSEPLHCPPESTVRQLRC